MVVCGERATEMNRVSPPFSWVEAAVFSRRASRSPALLNARKGHTMARVIFSITHEFDNGESSTNSTNTGALTATEASAMEQYWTRKIAEGMLRLGAFASASRDPEFARILSDLTNIMEGKSPASA